MYVYYVQQQRHQTVEQLGSTFVVCIVAPHNLSGLRQTSWEFYHDDVTIVAVITSLARCTQALFDDVPSTSWRDLETETAASDSQIECIKQPPNRNGFRLKLVLVSLN